ncbi:hypothetical protein KEM52_000512 [Ascosphaera acerosa]|nr:hypothetical protein KEM52_000512 [Ascosphaera acerosa]
MAPTGRRRSTGARFANGFEAPSDLARRLLDGKAVRFRDDEEKRRAMQIAREMLAERAVEGGEAGEAEGDGKAPPELHFQAVDDKACADMLDRLVAGSYAGKAPPVPANASPALRDTIRMLKNNETYQSEDIQKFVGLLNKALPPARPRT